MANPGMTSLNAIINKLQDHVSTAGMPPMAFNLPQIVVVGSQSVGKSSVLENFVGREFLPRGAGIVTRRPLVLQMHYDSENEYGEFSHDTNKPPRKYMDFKDIHDEIEAETEREAPGKYVSSVPINLRIHSPNVLDLTLVDLPGLTLVATVDQPDDIVQQLRDIVLQYASQSNALILAVSPATEDLANSAALKLAKDVDPRGERTISVITKIDLMAPGNDAQQILSDKLLKLKLGHWAIINVSREKEREFFAHTSAYREPDIAKRCGTSKLQAVLVEQLSIHIRDCLPGLRESLRKKLAKMKPEVDEHRKYEAATPGDALLSKYKELNGITQYLASAFERSIEATSGKPNATDVSTLTSSLDGGARISNLFHVDFQNNLKLICSDENNQSDDEIEQKIANAIHNSHGIRSVVFPHQKAFEVIVSERICLMHEPCERCVDDTVQQLQATFANLMKQSSGCNISSYPALRNEIELRFEDYLAQRQILVKDRIEEFIKIQRIYFNTNHKDFVKADQITEEDGDEEKAVDVIGNGKTASSSSSTIGSNGTAGAKVGRKVQAASTSNDPPGMAQHIKKVHAMMRSYMDIEMSNLYDYVPKLIVTLLIYDLIDYLREGLPSELQAAVSREHEHKKRPIAGRRGGGGDAGGDDDDDDDHYSDANDVILHLMEETAEVIGQRKEALRIYDATRKALRIADTTFVTAG